jgi:hypothetical protein
VSINSNAELKRQKLGFLEGEGKLGRNYAVEA